MMQIHASVVENKRLTAINPLGGQSTSPKALSPNTQSKGNKLLIDDCSNDLGEPRAKVWYSSHYLDTKVHNYDLDEVT